MKQCNSSLVKMFLARDTDAQCSFIDVLSKTQNRKEKLKEVLFKAERFFFPLSVKRTDYFKDLEVLFV